MSYRFEGDDRKEFNQVMLALATTYDKELTTELVRLYMLALSDCDVKDIKRRALEHMKESKWFPRPAELRPSGAKQYAVDWQKRAAISAGKSREDYQRISEHRKYLPTSEKTIGELVILPQKIGENGDSENNRQKDG